MDSNSKPTVWQSLGACIAQLALALPIVILFMIMFFMLLNPTIKWTMTLLPILGEEGLQLFASVMAVIMFGCIFLFSQSNLLISLRSIFASKMPKVNSKVVSYFLFILYLIPVSILFVLIAVSFGIVHEIKTKLDWVYYGIFLLGLFLVAFMSDRKKKQQELHAHNK